MKFAVRLCAVLMIFVAVPALAGGECYEPAQLQAEHLLRLHSELMVITVVCRQGSRGEDLPASYGSFTRRNIRVLHDAEQTMIAYFKAHMKGDPTDNLDRLRTKLGNEFGQKSADMSSSAFCDAYRDKVWQFDAASPADIDHEIQRMQVAEHSYLPLCTPHKTVVAGKSQ